MKKNTNIVIITILSIIVVALMFLLIYSNLYIKDNNIKINKDYAFENLTISEFNYTIHKRENKTVLNFKMTNNIDENIYGFYIRVYLKNNKGEIIHNELINIPSVDAGSTKEISFEIDKKIANIQDFEFKKVMVEGAG